MTDNYQQFEQRKHDHIRLALLPSNQALECNVFDGFDLTHEAIPNFNFSDISIESMRFGKKIGTPFFVSSMTAGHADAKLINGNLMAACAHTGWAMAVGSQRRELTDRSAAFEWSDLRKQFAKVSLFSNIGISQLITARLQQIIEIVESLNAEALIIHCNPLQEVIQQEGTPQFEGAWAALSSFCKSLTLPVVIKETGCGFSKNTLIRLKNVGVSAVDVSGLGGTHWGRIEGGRAVCSRTKQRAALTFQNWGINTVQSVENAFACEPDYEVWGSGGVRNGLDAAKLLALGVQSVGLAKVLLEAALVSAEEVIHIMETFEYELKAAMFCTGSINLVNLKENNAAR